MIPREQHIKMLDELEQKLETRYATATIIQALAIMRKFDKAQVTLTEAEILSESPSAWSEGVYVDNGDSFTITLPELVTSLVQPTPVTSSTPPDLNSETHQRHADGLVAAMAGKAAVGQGYAAKPPVRTPETVRIIELEEREIALQTHIEVLTNDLNTALGMLACWAVAYGDRRELLLTDSYHQTAHRDGPLRAMLDRKIEEWIGMFGEKDGDANV